MKWSTYKNRGEFCSGNSTIIYNAATRKQQEKTGQWTNIKYARKQEGSKIGADHFQPLKNEGWIEHQKDSDRVAEHEEEGRPEQETPGWTRPDLAHKNEANSVLVGLIPPMINAYEQEKMVQEPAIINYI